MLACTFLYFYTSDVNITQAANIKTKTPELDTTRLQTSLQDKCISLPVAATHMCQHFEHHINSLGICFWVSYENSTEKAHSAGSELTSTQSNLTNRGLLTVGDLSFGLYPGFRQNLGLNIGFNVGLNLCLKPNVKLLSRPGSTIILVF